MAHKKGVGSTDNGRDSNSKRLGVKLFGGQIALAGNILVRQRGTRFHAGENVYMGRDFTLHAKTDGVISFRRKRNNRTYISITPLEGMVAAAAAPVATTGKNQFDLDGDGELSEEEIATAKKNLLKAIGTVDASKKDDLKEIKGVGPKLEGVLNSIGIYTFVQISKMGETEYALVDALAKGFPGRAKRDDWAGQAKGLIK